MARPTSHQEIVRIARGDAGFPPLLAQCKDAPHGLYVRGNGALLQRTDSVAVVGTRKLSRYGATAAALLAGSLAERGIPVVSGLALGVDAAAHQAALDGGGPTIAVLAAGVTDADIGPQANFGLAMRILENGGAIVSEFRTAEPAYKSAFLRRNRIVAGMTCATVVIEAAARSGALATARMALAEGRDVFAAPGPITSSASDGTNRLIADGAIPAISPAYLLEQLGYDAQVGRATSLQAALADRANRSRSGQAGSDLDQDECAVLEALAQGAIGPDDIIRRTGLPARTVAAALTSLALKGVAV